MSTFVGLRKERNLSLQRVLNPLVFSFGRNIDKFQQNNQNFSTLEGEAEGPGHITEENMVWFKHSDLPESGEDVTEWIDSISSQTFVGLNALDAEASNATVDLSINGLKSINIDSSFAPSIGDLGLIADSDGLTIFFVVNIDNPDLNDFFNCLDEGFSSSTIGLIRYADQNVFCQLNDYDASTDVVLLNLGPTNIITSGDNNYIFCNKIDTTTGLCELWINGRIHGKSTLGDTGVRNIGLFCYGGPTPLSGSLGDLIIYPSFLDTSDQESIENYLSSVYSIPLNRLPATPSIYLEGAMMVHPSNTTYDTYDTLTVVNTAAAGSIRDVLDPTKILVQATANRRPPTDFTNGYLSFGITSGQEDTLATTGYGAPPTSGDITIVCLLHIASGATFADSRILSWEVTGNIGAMALSFNTTGRLTFQIGRAGYTRYVTDTPNSTVTADDTYLVIGRFNDTTKTWEVTINNTDISVSTSSDTTVISSTHNNFFISSTSSTVAFDFYACQVYNQYLSDQNCVDLYSYFQQRASI